MKDPHGGVCAKGLAHNPWIVTKVNNLNFPIMITTVALTNTSTAWRRGRLPIILFRQNSPPI